MSRKRKRRYGRICVLALLAILIMGRAYKTAGKFLVLITGTPHRSIDVPLPSLESHDASKQDIKERVNLNPIRKELYSPYAIMVRLKDHKIAFKSRSEERIYPASMTKIMTAIIAIENITDLKETVILPRDIFPELYAANASMAGFLPGEEVTVLDLLYGVLLPSGADASMGIVLRVSGSEDEFVKIMNNRAKQLNMKDTHFTNACGFYDDNHYTTVKDIAILLEYALKNKTFRKVFTSVRHSTGSTNLHPHGITYYSTMFEKMNSCEFEGGRILGGKTGYTSESGLCLASLAEKNGTEYILVTAGATGDHQTEQYHIIDAFTAYGKYLQN